jgi:hypothetical protein
LNLVTLVSGGMAIVTGLYSSLQRERESRSDRERQKTSKTRGEEIMLVAMREQHYVSEPIETKYSKF